jgi:hypothetical protein
MEGILSNFYQPIDPQESFLCRGALAWAPAAFLTEEFWEVKFSQTNPAIDFGKGWITLEKRTAADCHNPASRIFRHDPVHPVHLRATEAYAALRHKLRLTVVVSVGVDVCGTRRTRLKEHAPTISGLLHLCSHLHIAQRS